MSKEELNEENLRGYRRSLLEEMGAEVRASGFDMSNKLTIVYSNTYVVIGMCVYDGIRIDIYCYHIWQ